MPSSSSGPGRRPFKAVARVRIPLGAPLLNCTDTTGLVEEHVPVEGFVEGVEVTSLHATSSATPAGAHRTSPVRQLPGDRLRGDRPSDPQGAVPPGDCYN